MPVIPQCTVLSCAINGNVLIYLQLIASLASFRARNDCCEEDALIRTCLDEVGFITVLIQSSLESRPLMELAQVYKTASYHF